MQKIKQSLRVYIQSSASFSNGQLMSIEELDRQIATHEDKYTLFEIICKLHSILNAKVDPLSLPRYFNRIFIIMVVLLSHYRIDKSKVEKVISFASKITTAWKHIIRRLPKTNTLTRFITYQLQLDYAHSLITLANQLIDHSTFQLRQSMLNYSHRNDYQDMLQMKAKVAQKSQPINKILLNLISHHELETTRKLPLILSSLKFILTQFEFYSHKQHLKQLFTIFLYLAQTMVRSLKKFYHPSLKTTIQDFKSIALYGLKFYMKNYLELRKHTSQLEHYQKIIYMINSKQYSPPLISKQQQSIILLAHKILSTWRNKTKLQQELQNHHIIHLNQQQYYQTKPPTNTSNPTNLKKQIQSLKTKKAKSLPTNHQNRYSINNPIQIRNQIESKINQQFGKLNYLNKICQNSSYSINYVRKRKHSLGLKFKKTLSLSAKQETNNYQQVLIKEYMNEKLSEKFTQSKIQLVLKNRKNKLRL